MSGRTQSRDANLPVGIGDGHEAILVHPGKDVILRSPDFPKMKFNQLLLTPYFGPRLLPHAQTLWIDELAVGAERLGPLGRQ